MKIRRNYQTACPACHARTGQPCQGKQGERLPDVHFQRTAALRAASLAAFKALYAPLPTRAATRGI
jgi:cytochrome c553